MSTPSQRMAILGISPSKALGQHFLHDRSVVNRICEVARIDERSTVVEVGPGLGILTEGLAARAGSVIALEKDSLLAASLPEVVPGNVTIRHIDALEFEPQSLPATYDFVANLPYNVATAILKRFLDSSNPPETCTFMVQREVAERMIARPPEMNILAVSMQFHGQPRIAFNVGRGAFNPPPRVTSAVVHMAVNNPYNLGQTEFAPFFRLVRAGFSARRKQLKNSLENGGFAPRDIADMLERAGIPPTVRPQQLDVGAWVGLFRCWTKFRPEDFG